MHHRKMYMYINFQQNRDSISVKTVHTNLFAKNRKLHKFATCNQIFEKSRLSDMHYPLTDIQADFEINRRVRSRNTAKRNYVHRRQTDRRTDGRNDGLTVDTTDGQTSCTTTIGIFFEKKKKILKIMDCCLYC